jgi:hypothetical protein
VPKSSGTVGKASSATATEETWTTKRPTTTPPIVHLDARDRSG